MNIDAAPHLFETSLDQVGANHVPLMPTSLSGDLAVWHPDGYVEIKDRSRAIIISASENISSLNVEESLSKHPAGFLAAVVTQPDPTWGEVPNAFIELKDGADPADEPGLVQFCRQHLARFKLPKEVVFGPVPKTSTGKVQEFAPRELGRPA